MTDTTKTLPCPDPERIWLEPGMAWRQGWEMGEGGPGVEYVRADLYEQAQAELEEERLRSCRTCETAGAVVRRLELQLEKHRAGDAQEREALHDKVRDLEAVLAGVDWHWTSDPAEDDLERCHWRIGRVLGEDEWILSTVGQEDRGGEIEENLVGPTTLAECLTALRSELAEGSGDE